MEIDYLGQEKVRNSLRTQVWEPWFNLFEIEGFEIEYLES